MLLYYESILDDNDSCKPELAIKTECATRSEKAALLDIIKNVVGDITDNL